MPDNEETSTNLNPDTPDFSSTYTPMTLRPDWGIPGVVGLNPRGESKGQQKAISGAARNAYLEALRTAPGSVRDTKDGPVFLREGGGDSGGPSINGLETIGASANSSSNKWDPFPNDSTLMQLWYRSEQEAEDLKTGDFIGAAGAGAGRSYVDTEGDKQDEVTRQFKDFLARAKGTYDLMDSERSYAMAGDDQNIQNQAAMRAGNLGEAWATPYADMRGPGLSSTLSRSLPNYLSPDYRMNQAVGLGGPEGFDNANYDENGMPMYADGTDPAMANIPPELLAMVGEQMMVPPDGEPPSGKPWPWGRRAM